MKSNRPFRARPETRRPAGPAASRPKRGGAIGVEEVKIDELASGGRGVARRKDGRVVFVSGTCPGDRVQIEAESSENRSSVKSGARVLRVIEGGPARVEAPCPFVQTCGGCDWMHIASSYQEKSHAEIVRGQLAHAVSAPGAQPEETLATLPAATITRAPTTLAYRGRARFHVSAERRSFTIGYLGARSHEIVDVDHCAVLDPRLDAVLALGRSLLDESRGHGELLVALGRGGKPVLELRFDGELAPSVYGALDRLVKSEDGGIAGARIILEGVAKPAVFGDPSPVQMGADGKPVVLAPGGFAQPSDEGAALLAKRVAELAAPEGRHVVELFSGSGTLSVMLAPGAASFVGVELDDAASRAARANFEARGLAGKLVTGDADQFDLPKKTDVVVLDPPRTGAKGAVEAIVRARIKTVVYVSCDPPTLARDVRALSLGGYEIVSIDTLELFPQTSHVETVVVLKRARRKDAAGESSP